jgi:hypothetical protein
MISRNLSHFTLALSARSSPLMACGPMSDQPMGFDYPWPLEHSTFPAGESLDMADMDVKPARRTGVPWCCGTARIFVRQAKF